jgi:hypothetical protein
MTLVGAFELVDSMGPERDLQIVNVVGGGGAIQWNWVQVPLDGGRGYFVVAADYLAIGKGDQFCRVPMGGPAAQVIADKLDCVLPTAYMVDLIWRAGATKLAPKPFQDLTGMTTTRRFVEHNAIIEKQRQNREGLIVGCKKDLVVSNRLEQYPTAVCIYGWHQQNGQAIQPLSTSHQQWWYADYSHGVRLVKRQMVLDGQTVDVERVLRDPRLAHVLTGGEKYAAATKQNDAVLRVTRYDTAFITGGRPTPATSEPSAPNDLGQRALSWCQQELQANVREEPMGSNAGPRIAEYFRPARRRTTGQLLGIVSGDWCAVAQSAALAAVARPGGAVPHGYRAAVHELEDDARESKAWVPASDIQSGTYALRPGDLVLWTRGQPGSRLGHVSRVESPPDRQGSMVTIGGNEDNKWTRRTRNIAESEFRGAIKYHDFARVDFAGKGGPTQSAAFVQPAQQLVQTSAADKVLTEEGWLDFEREYLPRVVTGENGRAHAEALKAQAIASRTYVLRAMQDDPKLGRTVPIANSQKFQVFAKTALPTCIAAVESTRGMVAKFGGRLIIANYVAGAIWDNGTPSRDSTNTEKWVTYNEGKSGSDVQPTRLSNTKRSDNRGCMSQNGADWLARAGRTYEQILRFFYGADLEITGVKNAPVLITSRKGAPTTMQYLNAPQRSNVSQMPSGIQVLAMSSGAAIAPQPTVTRLPGNVPYVGATPVMFTVGIDAVQTEIAMVEQAIGVMDEKIKGLFLDTEATRKQWSDYWWSWQAFRTRNWYDTPLREDDALQKVAQFKSQLNMWNTVVGQRIYENQQMQKGNTYQGKVGAAGDFPTLPILGFIAVVGVAAALAASNS